jgi:copper homeostasis protein CutC
MAGAGVNPGNARELAGTGADALHFSAKTVGDPAFVREMVAVTNSYEL